MKKIQCKKILMISALVFALAISGNALADPETGYGRGMGYGYRMGPGAGSAPCLNYGGGMGYGPRGREGFRGAGCLSQLNEDEIKKIDEQRKAFFEATDDLRRSIYAKRLELKSEFVKKAPDAKKAGDIQKELSTLKAELAQKRIEHQIEMKKINPNAGMGFAGRGPGCSGSFGRGPRWR